jgi:glutamate-ammonia-ligase adenylyltransferase
MSRDVRTQLLSDYARAGFRELSPAREALIDLAARVDASPEELLDAFALAADPDAALARVRELAETHHDAIDRLTHIEWRRLTLLFGSSPALASFFIREPACLSVVLARDGQLIEASHARDELLAAVGADPASSEPIASHVAEVGANRLRVRYRQVA